MTIEETNKTIVVSYDDISRMKEHCLGEDGATVTKDFMDWYVNENAFFSVNGVLIVENILVEGRRHCIGFNFDNPELPEFKIYDYTTQKEMARFFFSKENNLTMKDIKISLDRFNRKLFTSEKSLFCSTDLSAELSSFAESKGYSDHNIKKMNRMQMLAYQKSITKRVDNFLERTCIFMSEQSVYMVYAAMYYFISNKPQEIIGAPKQAMIENGVGKQITAIYKYTGYVNILDSKIYKPIIKKDPNEPTREYGRHIERWSVRGHYRTVNGKRIWIEPFEKGSGELEKRVYGTDNETESKIIPKVFEVERIVYEKSQSPMVNGTIIKNLELPVKPKKDNLIPIKQNIFVSIINKIRAFIKNI